MLPEPKEISQLFDIIEGLEKRLQPAYRVTRASRQGELSLDIADREGRCLLYVAVRYDLWQQMLMPLWYGVRSAWGEAATRKFQAIVSGAFAYQEFVLAGIDPSVTLQPDPIAVLQADIEPVLQALAA